MTILFSPEAEEDFAAVIGWAVPPVRIYYQRHGGVFWVVRIYHQAQRPLAR